MDMIEKVKANRCKIEVSKRILKYADKLEDQDKLSAEEAVKFFRVK